MGTDIHGFIEARFDDGNWYAVNKIDFNRNYILFGIMAGVRCTELLHQKPKGLPEDVSKVTKFYSDDFGKYAHTRSWLTIKEMHYHILDAFINSYDEVRHYSNAKYTYPDLISSMDDFTQALFPYYFEDDLERVWKCLHPLELNKTRIVFWFDS
jgi:hypothetical protein